MQVESSCLAPCRTVVTSWAREPLSQRRSCLELEELEHPSIQENQTPGSAQVTLLLTGR